MAKRLRRRVGNVKRDYANERGEREKANEKGWSRLEIFIYRTDCISSKRPGRNADGVSHPAQNSIELLKPLFTCLNCVSMGLLKP